jgi:hypothetical protein
MGLKKKAGKLKHMRKPPKSNQVPFAFIRGWLSLTVARCFRKFVVGVTSLLEKLLLAHAGLSVLLPIDKRSKFLS